MPALENPLVPKTSLTYEPPPIHSTWNPKKEVTVDDFTRLESKIDRLLSIFGDYVLMDGKFIKL